ncbi:MAG: LytTR family DNA-binding domain-containing protein [Gemmatimonadota bacterium]
MDEMARRGLLVTRWTGYLVGWVAVGLLVFGSVTLEPSAHPSPGDLGVRLAVRLSPWWFLLTAIVVSALVHRGRRAGSAGQVSVEPNTPAPTHLAAPRGSGVRLVPRDRIRVLAADGDYVRVVHDSGEELVRRRLRDLEDELDPAQFQRVHRSTIVRIEAIVAVLRPGSREPAVELDDGTVWRVSSSYRDALAARLGTPV